MINEKLNCLPPPPPPPRPLPPLLSSFFLLFLNVAKHVSVSRLFINIHPSLQYSSRSLIHASWDFFYFIFFGGRWWGDVGSHMFVLQYTSLPTPSSTSPTPCLQYTHFLASFITFKHMGAWADFQISWTMEGRLSSFCTILLLIWFICLVHNRTFLISADHLFLFIPWTTIPKVCLNKIQNVCFLVNFLHLFSTVITSISGLWTTIITVLGPLYWQCLFQISEQIPLQRLLKNGRTAAIRIFIPVLLFSFQTYKLLHLQCSFQISQPLKWEFIQMSELMQL